jgi:hypothetical protein
MKRIRSILVVSVLSTALALPPSVFANDVVASVSCDFVGPGDLHVGTVNHMYGSIVYHASDFWIPKTGYYTTNWEWWPYFIFVVVSGNAPRGTVYRGTDPNFGHSVWRQDGSFTVWGDATKSLHTKAEAEFARSSVLMDTTTGVGHTWDDWDRCMNGSGWVTISS